MNDKTKSILAIMLIITTLSGIFLYWGIRLYQQTMDDKIADTTQKMNLLINEVIKNSHGIYDHHLDVLTQNNEILLAFSNRDRKALYQATVSSHNALKANHPYYSNMHFHLPSGHSFLRMHKPDEFGDDLQQIRPIIMKVHKTLSPVSGYEIGKHGLFYRVAKPVFYNDRYIGAVEIGVKTSQVAQKIDTMLNIKVARVIDGRFLNDAFRNYRKNELQTQGFYINPYEDKDFFSRLALAYDFKADSRQTCLINGIYFIAYMSGNLNNFQGQPIARFLIAQDITEKIEEYHSFLIRSIGLTLILIAGAFIILHFSFGSYINKIIELNKTLENKVKDRTRNLLTVTEKLQYTNAELDQIFDTAADGMRVIDRQFNVLRVNSTFVKLTGEKEQTLLNDRCHSHFRGKFCFSPDCTLNRIINGEDRIEIDVARISSSGEKRSFLLTATPFKSSDGELLGVVENFKDITNRKKAFNALKEHEQYLNSIMTTVQAGVILTDEKTPRIIDANPYAAKLIGCSISELKQSSIRDYFSLEKPLIDGVINSEKTFEKEDHILTTTSGEKLNIRLSVARTQIQGKTYLVQSFSDITDVKRLVEKQVVDIHGAKSIMNLINPHDLRNVKLPSGACLFTDSASMPCNLEGGDHLFIKHFTDSAQQRTIISLKDQSGHEVNCILRSIYTDLLHNAILFSNNQANLDEIITQLNTNLCQSHFFNEDDFFTAITVQIDHQSLVLEYLSAGHPPFLLIRDKIAVNVPGQENPAPVHNLPIPFLKNAQYASSQLQLRQGDQLIFYTDGLIEMPLKNLNTIMSPEDLKDIAQDIIDNFHTSNKKSIPVCTLSKELLKQVADKSQETVLPSQNGTLPTNTSSDDVSIIGVEIEQMEESIERIFFPKNSDDLSELTKIMLDLIFKNNEHKIYDHLNYRVKKILEEAVINAWKHGNRMNSKKSITVRYSSRNDFLLEILDQGAGFDFSNLPDPTSEENIEKQSGRGLFIIRHFSDQVHWQQNGNHIIICVRKLEKIDNRENSQKPQCQVRLWEIKKNEEIQKRRKDYGIVHRYQPGQREHKADR